MQKKDEIKASFTAALFKYLTNKAKDHEMSFQSYASALAVQATHDARVIHSIAAYFRRGFKFKSDEMCIGRVIAPKYEDLMPDGKLSVRRSLKLEADDFLRICEVANAIVCPPATAATILLFAAQVHEVDIEDTHDNKTVAIS